MHGLFSNRTARIAGTKDVLGETNGNSATLRHKRPALGCVACKGTGGLWQPEGKQGACCSESTTASDLDRPLVWSRLDVVLPRGNMMCPKRDCRNSLCDSRYIETAGTGRRARCHRATCEGRTFGNRRTGLRAWDDASGYPQRTCESSACSRSARPGSARLLLRNMNVTVGGSRRWWWRCFGKCEGTAHGKGMCVVA